MAIKNESQNQPTFAYCHQTASDPCQRNQKGKHDLHVKNLWKIDLSVLYCIHMVAWQVEIRLSFLNRCESLWWKKNGALVSIRAWTISNGCCSNPTTSKKRSVLWYFPRDYYFFMNNSQSRNSIINGFSFWIIRVVVRPNWKKLIFSNWRWVTYRSCTVSSTDRCPNSTSTNTLTKHRNSKRASASAPAWFATCCSATGHWHRWA